jgi:hypothetical protein
MNCPSCGLKAGDGAVECSGCGVIFAKWKARQDAPPRAKPDDGLGAGPVLLVLALALSAVWLYAKKTIVFPVKPPDVSVAKPAKLYLGAAAKVQGEIPIPINPLMKFDGYTKRQICDLRKSEVARHPEIVSDEYQPDDRVFRLIEDGKPWWGLEGIYFYGDGMQGIAGLSEESRFIPNPYLLVGLRESVSNRGHQPDGSIGYFPTPRDLSWNASGASAHVVYDVSSHFDFTVNHHYPSQNAHELEFVLYNADDLGFKYFSLDPAKSRGVQQEASAGIPAPMRQFIHCGGSCGYPGGCNNMSPFAPEFMIQVPVLPAKAVLKLWKAKPETADDSADMTFIIDIL